MVGIGAYCGIHTEDYNHVFFRSKNLLLPPFLQAYLCLLWGLSQALHWGSTQEARSTAHIAPQKALICFQQTLRLSYKIPQLLPSFLLYPPGNKLEASTSCHAQAIQSSLMMTEAPWGCQHFYSGAIVAKQQGNNSHKFLCFLCKCLCKDLCKILLQEPGCNHKTCEVHNQSTGGKVHLSLLFPVAFREHQKTPGSLYFRRAREHPHPAPHCTCVYFARISWGQMLGVRAEKGPPAEGVWWPKQKKNT